jgi:pyrimidine operon attenuation protein / uracil phosphoribosyltransferase
MAKVIISFCPGIELLLISAFKFLAVAHSKKYILTKEVAEKKLRRMALEVCEKNYAENEIVVAGIKGSGMVVAEKICAQLKEVFAGNIRLVTVELDKKHPAEISVVPATDFNAKIVLLVDDVANSGKTMLYALKPLLAAYPKKIQTLALVERTHKSFPVDVDYTGLSVSTTPDEHIYVEVVNGEIEGAWIGKN